MIHAGKAVVVTGGAKGIGRGIVERFCAEGAHVVIADVDESAAQAAAAEIGGSVRAAVVDVREEDQIRGAIGVVVDMAGHLDVMVNNAGVIAVAPIVDTTAESWRRSR